MDSAVFLALMAILQIAAVHSARGEADDFVTERRLEAYRKRLVTSLSNIVKKKIPLQSGTDLGRATDTYNCGKCYLSHKVTDDSKCIKSCTRIMRFASISPPNEETKTCDSCVATALNRPNRDCEEMCTVRHLTTIMAEVVNESISFREKTLFQAIVQHQGDTEAFESEINSDYGEKSEPVVIRARTRKAGTSDRASENLNQYNDLESQRGTNKTDHKSDSSDVLDPFRINSNHNGSDDEVSKVSEKVDEEYLNGKSGDLKSDSPPKGRSAVYQNSVDGSGHFVHPKGRSLPGSRHRPLTRSNRYQKNFQLDNKVVITKRSGAGEGADGHRTTENIKESDFDEDLTDVQETVGRSGGFSLREILSETVTDLDERKQARITKSLNKLVYDEQSSRSGLDFRQRSKTEEAEDSDFILRLGADVNEVKNLTHSQQQRISNAFKALLSNQPTDTGDGNSHLVHQVRKSDDSKINARSDSARSEERRLL